MEIKHITMKQLVEEVAKETAWGPQRVMEFAKQSLEDGDKFFALNIRGIQYRIPIDEVDAHFNPPVVDESAPQAEPTTTEPTSSPWSKRIAEEHIGREETEETEKEEGTEETAG